MTRWGYTVMGNSVILYQSGSECAHFSLFGGCWVGIPCSFITWRPAAILRGMWSATTAHSYTQKQGVGVDRGLFQWTLSLFNLLAFLLDPTPWQEEKEKSDNLTQHSLWRQSRITVGAVQVKAEVGRSSCKTGVRLQDKSKKWWWQKDIQSTEHDSLLIT